MGKVDVGWLWHRQLAHVNRKSLQSLLKGDHVRGLTNASFAKDRACSACIKGKIHETSHCPKTIIGWRTKEIHVEELQGPFRVDDSRWSVIRFMKLSFDTSTASTVFGKTHIC